MLTSNKAVSGDSNFKKPMGSQNLPAVNFLPQQKLMSTVRDVAWKGWYDGPSSSDDESLFGPLKKNMPLGELADELQRRGEEYKQKKMEESPPAKYHSNDEVEEEFKGDDVHGFPLTQRGYESELEEETEFSTTTPGPGIVLKKVNGSKKRRVTLEQPNVTRDEGKLVDVLEENKKHGKPDPLELSSESEADSDTEEDWAALVSKAKRHKGTTCYYCKKIFCDGGYDWMTNRHLLAQADKTIYEKYGSGVSLHRSLRMTYDEIKDRIFDQIRKVPKPQRGFVGSSSIPCCMRVELHRWYPVPCSSCNKVPCVFYQLHNEARDPVIALLRSSVADKVAQKFARGVFSGLLSVEVKDLPKCVINCIKAYYRSNNHVLDL